jgi:hypothetical protein
MMHSISRLRPSKPVMTVDEVVEADRKGRLRVTNDAILDPKM